ncbi:MAG TPA: CvpA family protein [Oscillospiraceae bacterium]|nr:CvpA family protein [Oscillospiraceae bacterium]
MMNWFDFLLVAIVVFFAIVGWQKGLVRQLFDLLGVIASYFVALRYSNQFVYWLNQYLPLTLWFNQLFPTPTAWGIDLGAVLIRLVGFALLFGAVSLVFRTTGAAVHSIFSLPILDLVNGLGGLLLGAIRGVFLALILIGAANLIGTPFLARAVTESAIATTVLAVLPVVYEQMLRLLFTDFV